MRIGVFVNIANQFNTLAVRKKGHRVNYDEYLKFLHRYGTDISAVAYGFQVDEEARSFIYILKKIGYSTRFMSVDPNMQPSRNVEIAIDILKRASRLDVVVLGTNDPELIPLIIYLRDMGIKVIVATVGLLHQAGTENIELLDMKELLVSIADMKERRS